MPAVQSQGNCQYTVLNGTGTTTINQTPPAGGSGPSQPQVFYGANVVTPGTTFVLSVYDVIPAVGGVAITTNTLMQGTATAAGQQFIAGIPGVGVRFRGQLLLVTTGTPGQFNALWD